MATTDLQLHRELLFLQNEQEKDKIDLTTQGANVVNSAEELQSKIYPNLKENHRKSEWLHDCCILATRNDIVEKINTSLMEKVPGESVV